MKWYQINPERIAEQRALEHAASCILKNANRRAPRRKPPAPTTGPRKYTLSDLKELRAKGAGAMNMDVMVEDIADDIANATTRADRRVIVGPITRSMSDGTLRFSVFTVGFNQKIIQVRDHLDMLDIVKSLDECVPVLKLFMPGYDPAAEKFAPDGVLTTLRLAESLWPCAEATAAREEIERKMSKQT